MDNPLDQSVKTCSIDGCSGRVHSRGLCQNHYRQQMRREKDPQVGTRRPGPKPKPWAEGDRRPHRALKDLPEDIPRRKVATESHCANGHPWVERTTYVDPRGRKICKICRLRSQRKYAGKPDLGFKDIGIWNRDKTHCPYGHPYDEENARQNKNGTRACRACQTTWRKMYNYGMTREEVEEFCSVTECDICGSGEDLCIDHDHSTGAVRGRLCGMCNRAIGLLQDKPDLLRSAADYLERYA